MNFNKPFRTDFSTSLDSDSFSTDTNSYLTKLRFNRRSHSLYDPNTSRTKSHKNLMIFNIEPVLEEKEDDFEEKKSKFKRCNLILDKKEEKMFGRGRLNRVVDPRSKSTELKLPKVLETDEEYALQKPHRTSKKYFALFDRSERSSIYSILKAIDSRSHICSQSRITIKEDSEEDDE